jgi:molybdopterin-guanine dinucleotide biosynthesis protein A
MLGSIILAGGKGNRIGGYKPLMKLGDRRLISYVLKVALKISDEAVVVFGRDDVKRIEALLPKDVKIAVDIISSGGPLIGVYSGLRHLNSDYVAVLPCDSPFVHEEVLKHLISKAEGADAAIPLWPNGYMEPLHSVYKVSAALEACEAAMEEEKFRIYNMIEKLEKPIYVPMEELRELDPELLTFFNINSREDLKRAEDMLKS